MTNLTDGEKITIREAIALLRSVINDDGFPYLLTNEPIKYVVKKLGIMFNTSKKVNEKEIKALLNNRILTVIKYV